MVATTIPEEVNSDILEQLMEYEMKKVKGEDIDGVGQFLKDVTRKYQDQEVTINMVKSRYYSQVKGIFDEDELETPTAFITPTPSPPVETVEDEKPVVKYDLDSSIENFVQMSEPEPLVKKEESLETIKPIKEIPKYLPGHRVTVRVQAVRPYGAIVQTLDDEGRQGLIHISKVKDHFITDLSQYFEEEDIISNVKIERVESDGKLSLSTIDTRLPLKHFETTEPPEVGNEGFKPLEAMINSYAEHYATAEPIEYAETNEPEVPEDIQEMMFYIKGIAGVVSPQALELLKEIQASTGTFKLSKAIFDVENDFQPDLSLVFVQEVKKRLDVGL